ncbi:MAG TPA: hypothetical protein VHZ24_23075 [Pirellulales bacterium]|jgi:hypothetical protein|nr:hypothetical protein [Pirellulales bacterium]
MSHHHPSQSGGSLSLRDSFNLMYMLASAHATCLTPMMRHSFGVEALGWNGLGAFLVMGVAMMAAPGADMKSLFCWWLMAFMLQRLRTMKLVRNGWVAHSRYDGYPWLALQLPLVHDERTAKTIEPFLCLLGGMLLYPISEAVGQFVLLGIGSLSIKLSIERQTERVKLQRLRDAEIEQRSLIERYRGLSLNE